MQHPKSNRITANRTDGAIRAVGLLNSCRLGHQSIGGGYAMQAIPDRQFPFLQLLELMGIGPWSLLHAFDLLIQSPVIILQPHAHDGIHCRCSL